MSTCPYNVSSNNSIHNRIATFTFLPLSGAILNGAMAKLFFNNPKTPALVSVAALVGSLAMVTWQLMDFASHISQSLNFSNKDGGPYFIRTWKNSEGKLMCNAYVFTQIILMQASAKWNVPLSTSMTVCFTLCPNALALLAETFYFHADKK